MSIRRGMVLCKRMPMLAWLVASASSMALMFGAMQQVAEHHLRSDAEYMARRWAGQVVQSMPDLAKIFAGEPASKRVQDHLASLRHAADVSHFDFYSRDGRQLLHAGSIAGLPHATPERLAEMNLSAATPRTASEVHILRDMGPGGTEVYSEAYVPIELDGGVSGTVRVVADQTARATRIESAFRSVSAVVATIVMLLFGIGIPLWLRRLHEQRITEERVRYLANHDPLTGVCNRSFFRDAVHEAGARWRAGLPIHAVLCIDVDRFKEVNEAYGTSAGDEMLRQVTRRLGALVRSGDVVGRLGGDAFAVMQSAVSGSRDVSVLAQRIVESLSAPYELLGQQVTASASVGAALFGVDGKGADELLHRADTAMYDAKSKGRGQYGFYDARLERQLQERRELERALRGAIAANELELYFQPLFGPDGRSLRGYEALARWFHPKLGNVPPDEFVPLAEETGLIDMLGRWALGKACREATRWPHHLTVAVNLSATQFRRWDGLLDDVRHALSAAGLPAERLELEITESLLIDNTEQALQCLQELHRMGVRIAMDDFGTGYSSLAYLWRFPFDKVKIDRSFTQNIPVDGKVNVIVRSIVSLAHSLGIRVNAEGVETAAQLALLQEHGCDELQGFLLGRPMPADALEHGDRASAAARPMNGMAISAVCSRSPAGSAELPAH